MKAVLHTEEPVFLEFKPVWNDLLQRSYSNSVFSTWEWVSTWWEVYQPGSLFVISVSDDSGEVVGLAPWYLGEDQVIRGIGCIDVTDYIDVIVDRLQASEILNCLGEFLARTWDSKTLEICNIPGGSLTLELLTGILRQHGFDVAVAPIEVCPIVQLPDSWNGYLNQLDKKHRHEVRRKLRRAHGADLKVDWYTVNGTQDLDAEVGKFFDLMAESDPAKAKFLQDEQNIRFFKKLARVMHDRGWLQLNFLKINEEYVSAYFNFEYNNQVLIYNSGLSYEPYGHLSPGIVLLAHIIQRAIEKQNETLDFLRGDEVYKYRMGGKDTQIFSLVARPKEIGD